MLDQIALLAAVTVLGVLEQAYFALQVIYARRKYKVAPPGTAGPPEFERIFRAQANCSEYFPIFVSVLWVAGVFFQQAVAAVCGLLYLYARYQYFQGYALSAHGSWAAEPFPVSEFFCVANGNPKQTTAAHPMVNSTCDR
ncbi:leukotriene C4 synthase-like isoform X2 [Carettochelys insculpta]|uniref:leukotriene C4 synthase-like isoform X2 n=1 Tax=Carettochelys insculpta TaxID=44489 RepID=UPI003EB8C076